MHPSVDHLHKCKYSSGHRHGILKVHRMAATLQSEENNSKCLLC